MKVTKQSEHCCESNLFISYFVINFRSIPLSKSNSLWQEKLKIANALRKYDFIYL